MTLPHVPYAATTNPQMSYLDDTFAAVGAIGVISCTATGTNAYVITPQANNPTVSAYANYTVFSFIVPNSSSGVVTIQVGALAALPAYDIDGTTQLTTGDMVSGRYFACAYNLALNSGNGGFVRLSPNTVQAPGTAATKAQMQAATSGSSFVSPVQFVNSDFAIKALAYGISTGSAYFGLNINGALRNSTGNYTIGWTTAFASSTSYGVQVSATNAAAGVVRSAHTTSQSPSAVTVVFFDGTNNPVDADYSVWAVGRQP